MSPTQDGARPVLFYGLASMGMGHAGRARAVLPQLEQHFTVHLFAGGPARRLLAAHHAQVHRVHRPRYLFWRGAVSEALIYAFILATFPLTVLSVAWLMVLLLWHRPVAVVTDFETHLTYAAWLLRPLLRVPVIAVDHMAAFRFGVLPGFSPSDGALLQRMARQHRSIIPYATTRLIPYFARLGEMAGARWVEPPVRAELLALPTSTQGPVVAYLGVLLTPETRHALETCGLAVEVFGAPQAGTRGTVNYHRHNEDAFMRALAAAPFAVLHGGHMSLVDALALGKPVLVCPTPGHREQTINARVLHATGQGRHVERITVEALQAFAREAATLAPTVTAQRTASAHALANAILAAVDAG